MRGIFPHIKVRGKGVNCTTNQSYRVVHAGLSVFIAAKDIHIGVGYKASARLRGCCKLVEADVVSNSTNKIHQTTY